MIVHGPHRPHGPVSVRPGNGGALDCEDETYRIKGAVFEVNRTMGAGFLEAVYQECLAIEFTARAIPFVEFPKLSLRYRGQLLDHHYSPDFICFHRVIVELKAMRETTPDHRAQVLNYLKASGLKVGLLVNFGCAPARIDRLVL